MRIVGIFVAALAMLFGLRMILIAIRTAFSGKILVRTGVRSHWKAAPTTNEAWKVAFRDAIMGLLLITLGVVLLT